MLRKATQKVQISPKVKRIHLQRYLLSKVAFDERNFGIRDLTTIFENQLWLEQKVNQDPEFAKKFDKPLEVLSIILQKINFRQELSERAVRRLSKRIRTLLPNFILPQRNYKGSKHLGGTYSLVDPELQGKLTKTLKPKSRIGKGYSDKGSAKNLAYDGSPGWQEVATHSGPLYHKGEKQNEGIQTSFRDEDLEKIINKHVNRIEKARKD